MTGIVDDDGARRQADQALAVPVEPIARLDPTGFDPSRWAALRERGSWQFFGNADPLCPHCAAHCSVSDNEWWHLYSEDGPHTVECPSCDREFEVSSRAVWSFSTDEQEAMLDEEAIAMEASGGDGETRLHPKDDSAGPQDIAHD